MIIGFHTHILPKMDDGSANVQESMAMLKVCEMQGIDVTIATPHFYPIRETVTSFLERRARSKTHLDLLLDKIDTQVQKLPTILMGAEVVFFEGIGNLENIHELVIEGSNCMLLEMPYESFSRRTLNEVYKVISKHRITPTIAHVERYLKYKGNENAIQELCHMGAILQMSCGYILDFRERRKSMQMLKLLDGWVLGTDCHNVGKRKPNMKPALHIIEKNLGEEP